MNRLLQSGLVVLLVGSALATLGAQDLKEALRLLPATTQGIEVYRDAALLEKRAARVTNRFNEAPSGGFVTILPGLNLDLAVLAKGFTVIATFPSTVPASKREAGLVPVRNFPALVKSLKAVKASGRYTFTRGKAAFSMVQIGAYAAITADPAILQELKGNRENLAQELTPLLPWISSHDTVLLAPGRTLKQGLLDLRSALAPKAGVPPQALAFGKLVKPLLDMTEASATQGALAVDFPVDGSVLAEARLFLKPGSPLAQTSGATAPGPHPMAGLPAQGFVLGAGWSSSGPFRAWAEQAAGLGADLAPAGADPEKVAKAVVLARALNARVQSQAMSLGVPAKAGDPLFGQFRLLTRVDDAAAYMSTLTESFENQIQAKMLPAGMEASLVKDVLPGVPSVSQTYTLTGLQALPVPPLQLKIIMTMILGQPDRFTLSMASLDSHTVVGVLGGAQELKAALAPAVPALDQDPGVAAIDALLPAQASCRSYLAPDGLRALVQQVMDSFLTGAARKQLPSVPAAPPLALALHADAQGLVLSGAATPATLDALGVFFKGLKQLSPRKPEGRVTPPATAAPGPSGPPVR